MNGTMYLSFEVLANWLAYDLVNYASLIAMRRTQGAAEMYGETSVQAPELGLSALHWKVMAYKDVKPDHLAEMRDGCAVN